MWNYNNTDELYHFGIPGMKWGIRRRLYNGYQSQLGLDSRKLSNLQKSYEWQKKNNASINNSKGKSALDKIGRSKLLRTIREKKINRTKNKINLYKDSVKEDKAIVKNLKQKLEQHNKAAMAKTKMKIAEANLRAGSRQAGHDIVNSRKLLATNAHRQTANESYNRYMKLRKQYSNAKQEYKKLKKGL